MSRKDPRLPPHFWTRPSVARALSRCDFPVILEAVRSAQEWSQSELAHAVGYSQSWVSRVVNGRQALTLEQAREIAERLGIPLRLLRFAPEGPTGTEPAPPPPPGPADTAAGQGAPSAPLAPHGDDLPTAAVLHAITGGQRRLDGVSPARDLARAAVAHLELSDRAFGRAQRSRSPQATALAAAVSEAAGLTAWLHMDMTDTGSARGYYRIAIERARQARQPLLAGYMVGSLAAFEIEAGDVDLGLTLAAEAARCLGSEPHPTALAWLAGIRAVGFAGRGDADRARVEIATAEQAADQADSEAPPWPWVFPFGPTKVTGCRALAATSLAQTGEARRAFTELFGESAPTTKQRAVLLVDWARVHVAAGEIDQAFGLAGDALRAAQDLQSDRVLARVREFRRSYTGPTARSVRNFDERVADLAALPTVRTHG